MNPPTAQSGRRLIALRLATVTAAAVMGLWAPADAWADDEARSVSGFQAVALEGPFTVKVSLAEKELVRVSTPGHSDGAAALVETTVENRKGIPTLVIRGPRSWSWRKTQASITVGGPQFKALAVSGSGVLEASLSNQPSLLVQMAGSGDLRVHSVTTHQIEVNVAGSGDVRIKGAAQNLSVSVAGSGDAWLQELEAEDVRVSVAGSGDARRMCLADLFAARNCVIRIDLDLFGGDATEESTGEGATELLHVGMVGSDRPLGADYVGGVGKCDVCRF